MNKKEQTKKRKIRVRAKLRGISGRPRLSIFRSNRAIYAQLINDKQGKTLVAVAENEIKSKKGKTKIEKAKLVGKNLAKKAVKKKIKQVVFDRGPYLYHGRVKALAEGAREGGLEF